MAIKAIETTYRGYRFRSRLEARWAVFMDARGVQYEYEKEGFDLGGDGLYLPDFWLPECDVWLEIKPTIPTDVEWRRVKALAKMSTQDVFLFAGNIPQGFGAGDVIGGAFLAHWSDWPFKENAPFERNKRWAMDADSFVTLSDERHRVAASQREIDRAYIAARSARFEHGESGSPRAKSSASRTSRR
jgi:hypothetical protein